MTLHVQSCECKKDFVSTYDQILHKISIQGIVKGFDVSIYYSPFTFLFPSLGSWYAKLT